MYELKLTAEEAVLLDGKVNKEAQLIIDNAKLALTLVDAPEWAAKMVSEIIAEANKSGKLRHAHKYVNYCKACGKSAGYATYKRNGRYHLKGQIDYNKPLRFSAWEVADDFITCTNSVRLGYCEYCKDTILPALQPLLQTTKAEIPETLSGVPKKWVKSPHVKCTACAWEGHQRQLGKLRTLLEDGFYYGACPSCGAENKLFTNKINTLTTFEVVENA